LRRWPQVSVISVEDIETQIYWRTPRHSRRLSFWLEDIAETATKAVRRGEKLLAKAAISAIENLVIHYLSARKDNLSLHHRPDTLFVVESDVKQMTSCAYEALKDISRNAVALGDDATAIRVTEAYAARHSHGELERSRLPRTYGAAHA
jgi:hypothetical protein